MNQEKIKDTDLNVDRLENLAKLVVDRWDMESLVQFAQEQVFQDYQYDIDRAVEDAEDYTLEELDKELKQRYIIMYEILIEDVLEAVKLRLRFDDTGEFEKALLQLLKDK